MTAPAFRGPDATPRRGYAAARGCGRATFRPGRRFVISLPGTREMAPRPALSRRPRSHRLLDALRNRGAAPGGRGRDNRGRAADRRHRLPRHRSACRLLCGVGSAVARGRARCLGAAPPMPDTGRAPAVCAPHPGLQAERARRFRPGARTCCRHPPPPSRRPHHPADDRTFCRVRRAARILRRGHGRPPPRARWTSPGGWRCGAACAKAASTGSTICKPRSVPRSTRCCFVRVRCRNGRGSPGGALTRTPISTATASIRSTSRPSSC